MKNYNKKQLTIALIVLLWLGLIFVTFVTRHQPLRAEEKSSSKHGDKPEETISVQYYGIKILFDRVIFVIDITGSMARPLDVDTKKKAIEMCNPKGKKKRRQAGERIDWKKIYNHLDLAKAELIEAIKSLDKKTCFTVLTYNLTIQALEEKLVAATDSNKKKIIKKIEELIPESGTDAFFDALIQAIKMAARRKPIINGDEKPSEKPCDIFFLTDGAPTITEGTGDMPKDMIKRELEYIERLCEKRNVRINTIGIGIHDEDLMKKIAQIGNGKYVGISVQK